MKVIRISALILWTLVLLSMFYDLGYWLGTLTKMILIANNIHCFATWEVQNVIEVIGMVLMPATFLYLIPATIYSLIKWK